jgi:hypothetical protein
MFLVGDKVRCKSSSHENLTGTVVGYDHDYSSGTTDYLVEFDDKNLIPGKMVYPYWLLERVDASRAYNCECGLKHTREGGKHSDWCPLYVKET